VLFPPAADPTRRKLIVSSDSLLNNHWPECFLTIWA
jgi:hypothetical protein